MSKILGRVWKLVQVSAFLVVVALVTIQDSPPPGAVETQINRLLAGQTFDYLGWELGALYAKAAQASVPAQNYLGEQARKEQVLQYFELLRQADEISDEVFEIYSDPAIADPDAASSAHVAEYRRLRAELSARQAVVEGILEEQVSAVLAEQGFAVGGQVVPPVKFRFTPLPQQLVISPRHEIRRLYAFSLQAGLTVDRAEALEDELDRRFDVSSLVVPLGGIGLYPTMLLEAASLEWVVGVVAHEWAHNWLTMFPVGWHYDAAPELRTLNETAASIVENEIGPLVVARFYPELLPPPAPEPPPGLPDPSEPEPVFDFRQEMRRTRAQVDQLLKEGKIAQAEDYMEARRQVFWERGYRIRKLNQAYFAFHGAYADQAGAAGEDPVGPAVVRLREQSPSLKAFMLALAPMTSFDDLRRAVEGGR